MSSLLFLSYSLEFCHFVFIWNWNYKYTPVVPLKTIPDSRPIRKKSIPVFRPKRRKNDTLWGGTIWLIHREYYTVARRYEFHFRVAKQYFTNERSEWVKHCFCHEKIKFISSSRRVTFFLLYRQKDIDKIDFYSPIQKVIVTAQIYSTAI